MLILETRLTHYRLVSVGWAQVTTLDIKPPVFLNGTPAVTSVRDTQVSFSVQTDEPCAVFYALLPPSAAQPPGCVSVQGSGFRGCNAWASS